MFFCNLNFQLIFLKFTNELYLIFLFSLILYYSVKINTQQNYLLQSTVIFIFILTNHAILLNSGIEGYAIPLFFNHFILTQRFISCSLWVYLFMFLYVTFLAPLWTKILIKSQLILLLNLVF